MRDQMQFMQSMMGSSAAASNGVRPNTPGIDAEGFEGSYDAPVPGMPGFLSEGPSEALTPGVAGSLDAPALPSNEAPGASFIVAAGGSYGFPLGSGASLPLAGAVPSTIRLAAPAVGGSMRTTTLPFFDGSPPRPATTSSGSPIQTTTGAVQRRISGPSMSEVQLGSPISSPQPGARTPNVDGGAVSAALKNAAGRGSRSQRTSPIQSPLARVRNLNSDAGMSVGQSLQSSLMRGSSPMSTPLLASRTITGEGAANLGGVASNSNSSTPSVGAMLMHSSSSQSTLQTANVRQVVGGAADDYQPQPRPACANRRRRSAHLAAATSGSVDSPATGWHRLSAATAANHQPWSGGDFHRDGSCTAGAEDCHWDVDACSVCQVAKCMK